MSNIRKVLRSLVIVLLCFLLLVTGCSGSNNNLGRESIKKGTESKNSQGLPSKGLPQVELSWYFVGNAVQKDVASVEAEADKYLRDKINATIKLNCIEWDSWDDRKSVMIASGEVFDIMFTAGWTNYRSDVARGAFLDITDLWDKYAPKTKQLLDPIFIQGSRIDGRNYAVPTNKEYAHMWGILYRKDIAEKYGLDMASVKAFEDLGRILKTVKEKEPDMIGIAMDRRDNCIDLLDFDPVGDKAIPGKLIYSRGPKIVDEYETPELKALLETVHSYYLSGYIRRDAALLMDRRPDIKAGNAFCYISSLKPFADEEASISNGVPLGQVALTSPAINGNDLTGSMNAISRTSKNPERALMFLELVNTDKYLNNLINFGIEYVHWVRKSEDVIDYKPGLNARNSPYNPRGQWIFGNQYLNYFFPGQNTDKWNQFKKFDKSGTPSMIIGFNFNDEPVKVEVSAFINASNEFNPGLFTGTLDPEVYLPRAIEKYKAMGLDVILAEKQKQLNSWLADGQK